MSEYRKSQTNFTDRDCLVESLVAMGYAREHIEVHDIPQQLIDFQGHPTRYTDANGDKAEVIVRRKYVGGAANDLGFKKEADGKFSAVISQYDSGKHNAKWLGGLKTSYSEKNLIKTAKKQGFKYLGKKVVGGKVQLQWLDTRGA
jgi:hypothetical protein